MMDKDRAILIVCIFLCLSFTTVTNSNRDVEEEQKQNTKTATSTSFWLYEKLKCFYYLYSKIWSPATWEWQMFKGAFFRFISPRLGFSKGGDEALRADKNAAKSGNEKEKTTSKQDSHHQNEL